jgi:hypothetical protein
MADRRGWEPPPAPADDPWPVPWLTGRCPRLPASLPAPRVGRAGRFGTRGLAVTLLEGPEELRRLEGYLAEAAGGQVRCPRAAAACPACTTAGAGRPAGLPSA